MFSAVGANLSAADGARVIDAHGKLVMPGKLSCDLSTILLVN